MSLPVDADGRDHVARARPTALSISHHVMAVTSWGTTYYTPTRHVSITIETVLWQ